MSSNDFDGPYRPAGGRGADDNSGGARGAGAGGPGAQGAGRDGASRNDEGYRRGHSRGNANGAGKYPEPEGWGDDGFWRDSGIDSDYETGLNAPVRTDRNGPPGNGGYSYWADGKGWRDSPGDVAAQRDGGDATRADYGAGTGATASYGPPGGPGFYGGESTAAYGNGFGPAGPRPGGPGRGGPGGRGRRGGPGGPGRRKRKGSWWRHWTWKKALAVAGGMFVFLALAFFGAYEYEYNSTQIPSQELVADTYQNSTVYYSDGKTPIGTFAIYDRKILSWNQIPKRVDDAVMAAEDRSFMTEGGISPTGILRAAWDDLTGSGGSLSGGSTITQQFVRQYYAGIGTQQTISRKIKEVFVAMKISKEKSKQWILTNYLNTIYLGDNAYGVAAAAQTYFGVPVSKLTVAQAAVIAAIIQQPGDFWQLQYRPELIARWHYVLNGMVQMGDLTPAQAASQKFPKLLTDSGTQQQGTTSSKDPWAPYMMNVVANELEGIDHLTQAQLETGGYKIVTTISRPMEVAMYKAVDENLKLIRQQGYTVPSYVMTGAELQNPKTGAIIAMYPGRGQNMSNAQCKKYDCDINTAVYARELVGSSFKPYVLSTAVSEGMNVKTSILNASPILYVPPDTMPLVLSTTNKAKAVPGSHRFHNDAYEVIGGRGGAVAVQTALAQSSNTAFTDLAHRVGTANIVKMAANMGVNIAPFSQGGSGLSDQIGQVGMALGTGSLTVNEQDTMLSTIDDNGTYHSAHLIATYQAPGGPVQHGIVTTRVVLTPAQDSQVQYAMEATTVNGTGVNAAMSDGRPIIAKTGTTTNEKSGFFIGAIPQYSLVVGMFTQSQNPNSSQSLTILGGGGFGGSRPAEIWHTFAEAEFARLPIEQFQKPVFTGAKWNQVGNLPKPKPKHKPKPKPTPTKCSGLLFICQTQPPGRGHRPKPSLTPTPSPTFTQPFRSPSPPASPSPSPSTSPSTSTSPSPSTSPSLLGGGVAAGATTVSGVQTGLALGGILSLLPGSLLWSSVSRRRRRRRGGTVR